jgi:hypothetical protein
MPVATNPYSIGVAPKPITDFDVSAQTKRYKDEELTHKAPQVLPFNFDSANELISKLYIDLLELRAMFQAAESNSQVKSKNLRPIYKVIDDIGTEITQNIPELLDKLAL